MTGSAALTCVDAGPTSRQGEGVSINKAANLRAFFADPDNTVTRERIFFDRLSFDLKLAAARVGYHLHLYEPDVDRDGFDFLVEDDDDAVGWFQTKAVLASAGTAEWKIGTRFLRPSQVAAERYGWDPVEAGRGGGVILIEIADGDTSGSVTYRYTDFDILAAIGSGMLRARGWKGPGKPAKPAKDNAATILRSVRTGSAKKVDVPKNVFITVERPDDLLGVMGLRSELGYGMFAIREAHGSIEMDETGTLIPENHSINAAITAHHHLKLLCGTQPGRGTKKVELFDPFDKKPLPNTGPSVI